MSNATKDMSNATKDMSNATEDTSNATDSEMASEPRSTAERISFAIAIAMLIGILALVCRLWWSDNHQEPPAIEVSSSLEYRQDKFYIPFTVVNEGGETATTVQVIAELRINGEIVEWGEQSIDFLSRKEEAEGAFIFIQDPRAGDLTVRVAGYTLP